MAAARCQRISPWRATNFRADGVIVLGRTAIGRTTVRVLDMNSDDQVQLREALQSLGHLDWS